MKKALFVVLAMALSMNAHAKFGAGLIEPKMVVTCKGVEGSVKLSASEAKDFVSDLKNKNTSSAVCQKYSEFCTAVFALSAKELDCSASPSL